MSNQYRTITPKGVQSIFETLCNADPRIGSFRLGDVWNSDTKAADVYPLVIYELVECGLKTKGFLDYNEWNIKLYCFTQRRSDWENVVDAFSECHVILNDLALRFKKEQQFKDWGFVVDPNASVKFDFVLKEDRDDLVGVALDLTFLTPLMICLDDLPVNALPDVGLYYSASTITAPSTYLTCATLTGCTVIQSIQTDIANLYTLTGGTGSFDCSSLLTCPDLIALSARTVSNTARFNNYLPLSGGTGGEYFFTGQTVAESLSVQGTIDAPDVIVSGSIYYQGQQGYGVVHLDNNGLMSTDADNFQWRDSNKTLFASHLSSSTVSAQTYVDLNGTVGNVYFGQQDGSIGATDDAFFYDLNSFRLSVLNFKANSIFSGTNDVSNLFLKSSSTFVQGVVAGTNITTGGTIARPTVNVSSTPTFTTVTAGTLYSGASELSTLFIQPGRLSSYLPLSGGTGGPYTFTGSSVFNGSATFDNQLVTIGSSVIQPGAGKTASFTNGTFDFNGTSTVFKLSRSVIFSATSDAGPFVVNVLGQFPGGLISTDGVTGGTLRSTTTIFSGTNDVSNLFLKSSATFVQGVVAGTNVSTGGTIACPSVNVSTTPAFTTVSATSISAITFYDGNVPQANQQSVVTSTDFITSSSTMVDVTSLSFNVEANSTYNFQFWIPYKSSGTTTGLGFSIKGPSSPQVASAIISVNQSAGQFTTFITAYDGGTVGATVAAANTVYAGLMSGILKTTNAGTLQLRVARGGTGNNIVVVGGASGVLTKL